MKDWKSLRVDKGLVGGLAAATDLPPALLNVLVARGIVDLPAIDRFMRPRLSELTDPFDIPGMVKAADLIWKAIDARRRIVVYGDYDADGVTATALLVRVLRALGGDVEAFVPRRVEEGYGLTAAGLARCIERFSPAMLVTVDCGIGSVDEVAAACRAGIEVIVTDHHEVPGRVPDAAAVVNPKLKWNDPTAMLAGVGVAFKLCHALVKAGMNAGRPPVAGLDLRNYLDLVAVGTVADIVPLTGENRILVRHGLAQLSKGGSPGLLAIMKSARLSGAEVDSYHVGFVIGPRLNAAGRMGSAQSALDLLMSETAEGTAPLASDLEAANEERKRVEDEILQSARRRLEACFDPARQHGLVYAEAGLHVGTIGIVAQRLSSRFMRPVVVISVDESGEARGSCRSIEGLNIVEVLRECSAVLTGFGGHKMAAGLTLAGRDIEAFRELFNSACGARLAGVDPVRTVWIDSWLNSLGEADRRLVDALKDLKPFGEGNPAPLWGVSGVTPVGKIKKVGKTQQHLKMTVAAGGTQIDAIGFGLGGYDVGEGPLDLAFHLEENEYLGRRTLQLNVKEIRPSSGGVEAGN